MITELLPETVLQPALWSDIDREKRERACSPLLARWWEDADTELLESSQHSRIIAKSRKDNYSDSRGCFSTLVAMCGGMAHRLMMSPRLHEKRGWIDADINFGVQG